MPPVALAEETAPGWKTMRPSRAIPLQRKQTSMRHRQTDWLPVTLIMCAVLCSTSTALCTDCNNNGIPDHKDIATGTSEDCNTNNIPDECEVYVEQKLTASDGWSGDYFGFSVSISGDKAAIGAHRDCAGFINNGSTYIYRWEGDNWLQEAKLSAPDAQHNHVAAQFVDWGIPTAQSLRLVREVVPDLPLIASGGIETGIDVAKCIALGAHLAGIALPLLRPALGSAEAVIEWLETVVQTLRVAMFCVGAPDLAALRDTPYLQEIV